MIKRVNRTDKISFFLLKVMYFYAKAFSMVHFSIKLGDKPKLIYSVKSKFVSIGVRLTCLIVYAAFLPGVLTEATKVSTRRAPVDNYLILILSIQFISIAVFTIALIIFHVVRHHQFVNVINRAIDVFVRISQLGRNQQIFTIDFGLMILFRLLLTVHTTMMNVPQVYKQILSGNYLLIMMWCVEYYLWIGTLIVLDACFVGYVAVAAMYKNITDYMIDFEGRLAEENIKTMKKSCRRQMFRNSSEQLEECTLIYSDIFKIISDFHELFQFNILYTFYVNFLSVVALAHYSFWSYLIKGEILYRALIVGGTRTFEILLLVIAADTAVRRSRIPKHLNWDILCTDIDKRWDRAVDQFLRILRFQELKIEIYGLFQLNNELCLRVLSVVVAYLTILSQFGLLGYFHEEDY